jgi:hypothetical protein
MALGAFEILLVDKDYQPSDVASVQALVREPGTISHHEKLVNTNSAQFHPNPHKSQSVDLPILIDLGSFRLMVYSSSYKRPPVT